MLSEITSFIARQLSEMGVFGLIIAGLGMALYIVWRELQAERRRCEALVEKMQDLSKETLIMIERITSR